MTKDTKKKEFSCIGQSSELVGDDAASIDIGAK
jgi:hypothetical protein